MNDEEIVGTIHTMFNNINSREVKQNVLDFMKKTIATQGADVNVKNDDGLTPLDLDSRLGDMIQENQRNVRRRIGGAQALALRANNRALIRNASVSNDKVRPRTGPVMKPIRNIRRPEQARRKTLRDTFSVQSIDGNGASDEEIRSEISKMFADAEVTVDMVLAYIMLGARDCKEGVMILEDKAAAGVGTTGGNLSSGGGGVTRPVCYVPMSEGMTLIGGKLYVDMSELKLHIHSIVKDIKKNLETVRILGHDEVFNTITRGIEGGNSPTDSDEFRTPIATSGSVSSAYPESYKSADSSHELPDGDEYLAQVEEELEKMQNLDINNEIRVEYPDKERYVEVGYPQDIEFMGTAIQSVSKGGERHVMKIGYSDGSSYKHVVVKAALTKTASEGVDSEGTIYCSLKTFFKEFYAKNVLTFYGNGAVDGDTVRFVNEAGKAIQLELYGKYDGLAYIALEFNPLFVNVEDYLKFTKGVVESDREFSEFALDLMQNVLAVHKEGNDLCEFGHGDLKMDNVLIDTHAVSSSTDYVKIFDLEYSSMSGYVSDVYKLYNNSFLTRVIDGDVYEEEYDPVYLWYCDASRFMLNLVLEGVNFSEFTVNVRLFEDDDIKAYLEIMAQFCITHSQDRKRIALHFNDYFQSHEFISKVIQSAKQLNNN